MPRGGKRPGAGAPKGSANARPKGDDEKNAYARAQRKLNLILPLAVARLEQILKNEKSTHQDWGFAIRDVLDRRIPKMTQADIALTGAPVVTLRIAGLNWPAMEPPKIPAAIARRRLNVPTSEHTNGHSNGDGGDGA